MPSDQRKSLQGELAVGKINNRPEIIHPKRRDKSRRFGRIIPQIRGFCVTFDVYFMLGGSATGRAGEGDAMPVRPFAPRRRAGRRVAVPVVASPSAAPRVVAARGGARGRRRRSCPARSRRLFVNSLAGNGHRRATLPQPQALWPGSGEVRVANRRIQERRTRRGPRGESVTLAVSSTGTSPRVGSRGVANDRITTSRARLTYGQGAPRWRRPGGPRHTQATPRRVGGQVVPDPRSRPVGSGRRPQDG